MHRESHRWDSPSLGRPMELIWYGHWGRPVLMFPTSLGRASQNEDGGIIGSLAHKIEGGEIQVCSVDSVDEESWYNQGVPPSWRVARHDQYDRYLASEVIPLVRDKARREDVVLYGASFGGYHAVNFTLRHPDLVSRVISFSGVYDIHRFLDGYWNETCYFHCPTAYVANFDGEWAGRASRIGIVIATGEHDHLVGDSRSFADLLRGKGIPVHLEIWPGVFGHEWRWWCEHLQRFVP